jgi:hypothetical protein
MNKKIIALVLSTLLIGASTTVYASEDSTINTNPITTEASTETTITEGEAASETENSVSETVSLESALEQLKLAITQSQEELAALEEAQADEAVNQYLALLSSASQALETLNQSYKDAVNPPVLEEEVVVDEETSDDPAAVLPDSLFDGLEKALEQLTAAIAQNEADLAALPEEEANVLRTKYIELLSPTIEELNTVIETVQAPEESGKKSIDVLKSLLEKLPEQARKGIENAISHQEKSIAKKEAKLSTPVVETTPEVNIEEVKVTEKVSKPGKK